MTQPLCRRICTQIPFLTVGQEEKEEDEFS
jgi:hypothetical protein